MDAAATLLVDLMRKPGAVATTARARHRRYELPCGQDLYTPADIVRDVRHMRSRAADDLADWLVALDLQGKSDRTLYAYNRAVAPLLRSHPDKAFDEFTHTDINEELHRIPRRSRHISRSIYKGWFDWGARQERIVKNPILKVEEIKAPRSRPPDIFTDVERAQLEELPMPDGPLWTILFGTGLRRGEARRLQRRNIQLQRARLTVLHGKGDKDRLVGLPPLVIQAVADLDLMERLSPNDHLWYRGRYQVGDRRRRGDPIGDTTFEHWYKRGIEQAGVRYLNPHQTRHTYGWWLRNQGFTIEERQLLMGHENINTTQRFYDRTSIDDVAEKMAAL